MALSASKVQLTNDVGEHDPTELTPCGRQNASFNTRARMYLHASAVLQAASAFA